jgi:protein-S-isoprenylcysteine O-methyltransferase Ste14
MFISIGLIDFYFYLKDPKYLAKRMETKEPGRENELLKNVGLAFYFLCFLIPGLDYRFGWSHVPVWVTLIADFFLIASFAFFFWVYDTNRFGASTIRVQKGQKVISTGPYSIVRHPMYTGAIVFILATPFALGSYVALIPLLLSIPFFAARLLDEEKLLGKGLRGYNAYCRKVRWRLFPGVW